MGHRMYVFGRETFMLETLDLSLSLSKKNSAKRGKDSVSRLPILQRAVYHNRVPVLILFEGWYASGRGNPSPSWSTFWIPAGRVCIVPLPFR